MYIYHLLSHENIIKNKKHTKNSWENQTKTHEKKKQANYRTIHNLTSSIFRKKKPIIIKVQTYKSWHNCIPFKLLRTSLNLPTYLQNDFLLEKYDTLKSIPLRNFMHFLQRPLRDYVTTSWWEKAWETKVETLPNQSLLNLLYLRPYQRKMINHTLFIFQLKKPLSHQLQLSKITISKVPS